MTGPWLGMGLVLAALAGLMGGLCLVQRLGFAHPEVTRKAVHVGMGLVTLALPWLFDTAWPVLLLTGVSVAGLLAVRLVGALKTRLGGVLGGVARASLGEVYFPVAVAVLFLLYLREDPNDPGRRVVLYVVPLLLLTLADAAAALVGIRYGRFHYATADGSKSLEGSVAFFGCAFLCAHVPLLLLTGTGRLECVLTALLLAWLATLFEAIAWGGLDNLALPLVSYLMLRIYLTQLATDLGGRLLVCLVLTLFLAVYSRRTTLAGSAVLGAFLAGYVCWALGGWRWLPAPLLLFLSYNRLSPKAPARCEPVHNVHPVVCVASTGLVWLFLARLLDRPELLFPYTLAFAAHLAIIGVAYLKYDYPQLSPLRLLVPCVLGAWLLLFVPYLLTEGVSPATPWYALAGVAGVGLAALAFYWTQPALEKGPTDTRRWLRQAAGAGLGSALGLVPFYWS